MAKANKILLDKLDPFSFTILGSPQSKSNSRRLVKFGGTSRLIKSEAALRYAAAFEAQCPTLDAMFLGDVEVEVCIVYSSRRPDLDESLILDLMQGRIYKNDRQVKRKVVTWGGADKENPRAHITVRPYRVVPLQALVTGLDP